MAASNTSAAYSNPYDAALISAAASMFMNQNPRGNAKAGGGNYKPRPGLGSNPKLRNFRPPKPQQLHYCDACKISCAGPSVSIFSCPRDYKSSVIIRYRGVDSFELLVP